MIQKSYDGSGSLYLIPTPIGNLEDITIRGLNTLKMVDVLLCEDTRDTGLLLSNYDIKKKLISCHEHNEKKVISTVVSYLESGNNVGLVTDQGTPIISDPGYLIAKEIITLGYNVITLPGATAFVPALTMSGIEPSPFIFYGFLNSKKSKRLKELKLLYDSKYTLIFYESVHRIGETLRDMQSIFGNRKVAVCREISKIHEEVVRGTISELIPLVTDMRGEFVIIVEGNKEILDFSSLDIVKHVEMYVEDGVSEKEAIKLVAKERNVAKSVIYSEYHNRK